MTAPSIIAAMLERHEGRRQFVYLDSEGILTIAVGRNLRDRGLLPEEIDFLRDNDIMDCTQDLRSLFTAVWEPMGQVRQAALLDMRFALGQQGFRDFHKMIVHVIAGDWDAAADEAINSVEYTKAPARWQEDADMLRTGQAPSWWSPAT